MKRRCPRRTLLAIGAIYALAVILMTLPATFQLPHKLIGNNVDDWIFYWNNWWLERAIAEGRNWFYCPYTFYPQGANLVAHSFSFLNSLLAIAIKPLVGPIAAYNLTLLFGLWVSAVGMFLLARELTGQTLPALLAGFVFAFAPYHLSQALAHPHLGSIHWWPFYILFLRRTLISRRALDAAWAGLFAALTFWSGFQLAVLLAVWTALYVGWHILRGAKHASSLPRVLGLATLAGAIALALSAPLLVPIVKESHRLIEEARVDEGTLSQTDLLAYLLPPTYHPLLGAQTAAGYERFATNKVAMPYLGYTLVGLALAALLARRKESAFWLISALLWIVLAAGSALRFNGAVQAGIPLPYRFIGQLFPISTIRAPDRFNLLVTISLAILAGLGAAHVARKRRWLLVPISLLAVFEYLCAPFPAWDPLPGSAFFAEMARDESQYGVIDYPMGYTPSKLWLYYQTLHGKPTVEGHISRYTADDYAFIASNSLLRSFYQVAEQPVRLPEGTFAGGPPSLGPALQALRAAGVRYIIFHKPYADAAQQAHFQHTLPLVPIYEDDSLAVYDTANPLPFYYDGFPIPLADDVALAWFNAQPADKDGVWHIQILTILSAPRTDPLACRLKLAGESGSELELPVAFFAASSEAASWQAGAVDMQTLSARLLALRPGTYRWILSCAGASDYAAPDTLHVDVDGHTTYLRRSTETLYGEAIRLQGYRWWTTGGDLHISLYWKAEQKPQADYKLFVHLLNAEGELVRQYDAMPCNWQCPTSGWQPGDTIADQVVVTLAGLPPGEYRLAAGFYSAETGKRLTARDTEGEDYPDAYPLLPDAFLISEQASHE
jgi:hypothetical protein